MTLQEVVLRWLAEAIEPFRPPSVPTVTFLGEIAGMLIYRLNLTPAVQPIAQSEIMQTLNGGLSVFSGADGQELSYSPNDQVILIRTDIGLDGQRSNPSGATSFVAMNPNPPSPPPATPDAPTVTFLREEA